MKLTEIVQYLDKLLNISEIEDMSLNGLQVENTGRFNCIYGGVDISEELVKKCEDNSLILVHHGIFWGKPVSITRNIYGIIKTLIAKDCALYVSHLPLDSNEEFGNNRGFYKLIGWDSFIKEKFDFSHIIEFPEERDLDSVLEDIYKVLGKDIKLLDFGKKKIKRTAFISGGASSYIRQAISKDVDLYITGEPSHSAYWTIKENKLNVIFGGHYNTEKIGVNLLGKHLSEKFSLKYSFVDLPTGL